MKENDCIRLGLASSLRSQAGATFDVRGIFQTICSCTHGYAIGYVLEIKKYCVAEKGE